jgi:hypothetical protein
MAELERLLAGEIAPSPTTGPTPPPASTVSPTGPVAAISDEQLDQLEPEVAAIIRAQQQQTAALQSQLEQLAGTTLSVAQQQQYAESQRLSQIADVATDAYLEDHPFIAAEQRPLLESAGAPYAQAQLARGRTDYPQIFAEALEHGVWTTEPFRSAAIDARVAEQTAAQLATTMATRQKAAKSGSLASSPASVPRDAPGADVSTSEGRRAALVSSISAAMNGGQEN